MASGVLVLVVALAVLLLGGAGGGGAVRRRVRRARLTVAAPCVGGASRVEASLPDPVPSDVAPGNEVRARAAPVHVVPAPATEAEAGAVEVDARARGVRPVGVPWVDVPSAVVSAVASRPRPAGIGAPRSDVPAQPAPGLLWPAARRARAPRVGAGASSPRARTVLRLSHGRRPPATRADVVAATAAVAASLRAGSDPSRAWQEAIGVRPEPGHAPTVEEVLGALPGGGHGAAAHDRGLVRSVTTLVGATRLALLLGAPLAAVLDRCAATVEAEDETAAEIDAALAGPQQTATLLGWLPVVGLLLGLLLGADPVAVLTDGGWGTCCGAAGIGLTVLGRLWVRRMITRARAAGGLD